MRSELTITQKRLEELFTEAWSYHKNIVAAAKREFKDQNKVDDIEEYIVWWSIAVFSGLLKEECGKKSDSFYTSDQWRMLRWVALKTGGYKCKSCGGTNKTLHVDHIKPRSKFPELALDLNNLQVLCEDCNLGKSDWSESKRTPRRTKPQEIDL